LRYNKTMTAQISIDIRPIELDDKHYVGVIIDGHEMNRHGPYPDADTAGAMADRLIQVSRALTSSRPSGANKWAT
jgi:hypothetical protein